MNATRCPVMSALAGHSRTCWRQDAIADLEHARTSERDQDLRDRDAEVERDLAEDLERRDHGREVQARVRIDGRRTG
jgi:hypothetical protein